MITLLTLMACALRQTKRALARPHVALCVVRVSVSRSPESEGESP